MKTSFPQRRAGGAAVAAALLAVSGLTLAACSSPAHPAASATIAITPGSGQPSLAGMPGSTAIGPVTQPSTAPSAAGSMPAMSMPAGAAPAPTGAPVATDAVTIKNFAFAPAAMTVKVGTTVTWTNQDSDAHTVTSQNNTGPLNSQALNTGQSFSYTFTTPGTYHYLCTIHPFMTATVTVTR
ncbi:cupredoxin domain-containing protein [Streptacidiphilus anmyonensis]|uniref:cupredoxin domain-containing protein n=1 Tax=Streptacidiphilus anmyonensis TaxID=405782 RepID=UPI00128CA93E|nr:cupredoxin family copper-binding protein [Streptacidiphilus anmyonensis]